MPQGRVRILYSGAPRRPVRPPPRLQLTYEPKAADLESDIDRLTRDIAEAEERLVALRVQLTRAMARRAKLMGVLLQTSLLTEFRYD